MYAFQSMKIFETKGEERVTSLILYTTSERQYSVLTYTYPLMK